MQRRSFIEMFIAGTAGFVGLTEMEMEIDENVNWDEIKNQFPASVSSVLNLNNGSAGLIPIVVENQLIKFFKEMNQMAPYEALRTWKLVNEKSKSLLAEMIGAKKEEVAIVRNTTEALNLVLTGIDIPKRSKVVCALHDYGSAINTLERLATEKKFRLSVNRIDLPASNEEIIKSYEALIDENTSLVLLTAMTHREGQILPIKEITEIAKKKGALVVVDAAHAIGHYEHSVADWDCDYYCTSLHKWLSCPIGTGLLYMKKDLIIRTKGNYNAAKNVDDKILKFEQVGTKPFAIQAGVLSALHFQETIGLKAKTERLKSLTDYWVKGIQEIPRTTTYKPQEYGGFCAFHIPGKSTKVEAYLMENKIHIKKVSAENYVTNFKTRFRISPNIYHDFKDLDRLIDAMQSYEIT